MDRQSSFIKEANRLCNNNINFNLAKYHIRNLYPENKRQLFPNTIDKYYGYCLDIERIGFLCRYEGYVNLLNIKNEIIQSKFIIFFSDYDINRLIVSHHLLMDDTFVTIESFYQTLIIMYYDIYTGKMIPTIFACMDNKTTEGYIFVFQYIKDYIKKILKNKKIRI